jgi:hypothetical protein
MLSLGFCMSGRRRQTESCERVKSERLEKVGNLLFRWNLHVLLIAPQNYLDVRLRTRAQR